MGKMATELIIKLLLAGIVIALEYAITGKIQPPLRKLKAQELRILSWMKRIRRG